MSKFNKGDTVFDLRYGFGIVKPHTEEEKKYGKIDFRVCFNCPERIVVHYFHNGKINVNNFAPSLLTLKEAAKLGYFPEQRKKIKKKLDRWIVLDPVTKATFIALHEDPGVNWRSKYAYPSNYIVVKTTLE